MRGKLGCLLATLVSLSCSEIERAGPWQTATKGVLTEEYAVTNGMNWPGAAYSPEIVMTPDFDISACTGNGCITIAAGQGYERTYTWDEESRSVALWPRKKRWLGSLGLYFPGPGNHWKANHGITRGVLEEGVLWFVTSDDALRWIERSNKTGISNVYNRDGLVVGFGKFPERKQINVNVWQIMVAGEKPRNMPGSDDEKLSLIRRSALK